MRKPPSLCEIEQGEFGVGQNIVHMDDPSFEHRSAGDRSADDFQTKRVHVSQKIRLKAVHRDVFDAVALDASNVCFVGAAKPGCRLDQRVEHGPQIKRRAADHLEHVGGSGLLLQRFAQLVEQASILDCDDDLLCKVAYKLDLLVSEGKSFAAADEDRTDRRPRVKQGYDQCRAMAATEGTLSALWILIAVEEIWDVDVRDSRTARPVTQWRLSGCG